MQTPPWLCYFDGISFNFKAINHLWICLVTQIWKILCLNGALILDILLSIALLIIELIILLKCQEA
jgi:hypothetical protein